MADVFISYARSTEDCARAIARIVEADGHSVWYDACLPAHRAYADVIQEQLDLAKAVLIIWSREAVRSQWVRSEADRARMNGTLIQMRIEDCVLPMPFDQFHCPIVERWEGAPAKVGLSTILTSLSELLNGDSASMLSHVGESGRPDRPEEAQLLFEGAMKALQSGKAEEHAQAIPLLIEATTLAPKDPEPWGLLAVLYAARRLEVSPAERPAMVARARSAIKTTLSLDPDEIRSRCAEVILITSHRNWERKEKAARAVLDRAPDQPLALFSVAWVLAQVGRWDEAVAAAARISRTRFLLPAVDQFTVQALWAAGDIVQAELAAERASRRFPAHAGIWDARLDLLMHGGRAADAIRMIEHTPAGQMPTAKLKAARLAAEAMAGNGDPMKAVQSNLEAVRRTVLEPLVAAQRCAALGFLDDCFALLDGYYLETGPWAGCAPGGGHEDRSTFELFMPPMEKAWHDPRFEALTGTIGLADYWTKSGVKPDYRR